MTYIIEADVKGHKYWVSISYALNRATREYTLQGLKDNATVFHTREEAKRTFDFLIKDVPMEIVENK